MTMKKLWAWFPGGIAALIGRFFPDLIKYYADHANQYQQAFSYIQAHDLFIFILTAIVVIMGFYLAALLQNVVAGRFDDDLIRSKKLCGFWLEHYKLKDRDCVGLFQIRLKDSRELKLSGYSFYRSISPPGTPNSQLGKIEGEWSSMFLRHETDQSYTYVFRGKIPGRFEDKTPLSGTLNFSEAYDTGHGHFFQSQEDGAINERVFKKIEINYEKIKINRYVNVSRGFQNILCVADRRYLKKPAERKIFEIVVNGYLNEYQA